MPEYVREVAQPDLLPPLDRRSAVCGRAGCGAGYSDDDRGRFEHRAVFGHTPTCRADQLAADA